MVNHEYEFKFITFYCLHLIHICPGNRIIISLISNLLVKSSINNFCFKVLTVLTVSSTQIFETNKSEIVKN